MIISFINRKGGPGKTTCAIHAAVGFALRGYETVLVDTDEDGTSTAWFSGRDEEDENLTVLSMPDEKILEKNINKIAQKYEVIVIDGAPHLKQVFDATIWISDLIVIPVQPSASDIWKLKNAINRLVNLIEQKPKKERPQVCFFINRLKSARTKLGKEAIAALETYELPIFESRFVDREAYKDSIGQSLSAFEYNDSKAEKEADAFLEELEEYLGL